MNTSTQIHISASIATPSGDVNLRNLEQIRAKDAIEAAPNIKAGNDGGKAVAKKVPAMIMANGFIGALAFALDDNAGLLSVFEAVLKHLQAVNMNFGLPTGDPTRFLDGLCAKDAATLRAVTDEAMAYLSYLRRFAKPGKETKNGSDSAH